MIAGLVGRAAELADLGARFAAAKAGKGSAVLVAGEAGIGKSALVERLREDAERDGVPALVGRSLADPGAPSYWPWRRMFGQRAAAELGLTPALLDVDPAEPPAAARFTVVERCVGALSEAAQERGLIVVVEDVHWADEASLQLLRCLLDEIAAAGTRMLIVATCRDPADRPAAVDELMATIEVRRLHPLEPGNVATFVAGLGAPVHPSWPQALHRHSGGNPLFLRELTHVLVQQDRLTGPAGPVTLPAQLRALIVLRLNGLSPECRRLVDVAGVLGEDIDVAVLTGTVGECGSAIAEAVTAGVLVDDPDVAYRLRFAHDVIRLAVYAELPRAERLGWHRAIADVLESAGSGRAGELAMHRLRSATDADSMRVALAAVRTAAADAAERRSPEEAARWYTEALAVLDRADLDDARRCEVMLEAATALFADAQVDDALGCCVQVADLAERLGRADLVAAAALVVHDVGGDAYIAIARLCERARKLVGDDDSALLARLLAQHASALYVGAKDPEVDQLSARALAMAERSNDVDAVIDAIRARHTAVNGPDGVSERLRLGARMRELARITGSPETAMWGHLWRIDAALELGSIGSLDTELAELSELVTRMGWPLARWHLLRVQACRALLSGRFAAAEDASLAAWELSKRTQDRSAAHLYYSFAAFLALLTGSDEHEQQMRQHCEPMLFMPIVAAPYARYLMAMGDVDAARAVYDRLLPELPGLAHDLRWLPVVSAMTELAVAFGDEETLRGCYAQLRLHPDLFINAIPGASGSVARFLGNAALALRRWDDADRHLTSAESLEARVGAAPFLALAQVDHATALRARNAGNDRHRALALANKALHTAVRLGMRPAAHRAQALVDDLSAPRADAAALTPREREIAGLVATGQANRAIAERLVLSERTVESHVRNILIKLGQTNRTQLAAWAVQAGLVPGDGRA